jgi:ribosome biogenesis GTPase
LHDENLSTYFPEMLELQTSCKYYNCTHTHEPGCKVVEAVKNGKIAESRYRSYLSMLFEDSGKYREANY